MKKMLSLTLALVLGLSVLTGCAGNQQTTAPGSSKDTSVSASSGETAKTETTFGIEPLPKMTTINVGYFSGALHSAIFYIAEQEGFLDEVNIKLNYQSFSGGPAMMEANSSWDVATTGGPGALVGVAAHPIKVIGLVDYEQEQCLYVREDSPIYKAGKGKVDGYPEIYGTATEWKGTTWLMPVGTMIHKVFLSNLERLGLTAADVTVINMDVSSALAAFKAGEGDGLGVWMNISLSAADAGFKKVAGVEAEDTLAAAIVATDDALSNKRTELKTLYAVYLKTIEWCAQNKDAYAKYLFESCEIEGVACTEDTAMRLTQSYTFPSAEKVLGDMTTYVDDPRGIASRQLSRAEADLYSLLDFFIEQGTYTDDQRKNFIDNHAFDAEFAGEMAKQMLN